MFEGIPGGFCTMHLKVCLSSSLNDQSELVVTGQVEPPENSWFKESIRSALLEQIRSLWAEIKCLLYEESNLKAIAPMDETIQQVYFDSRLFFRSIKQITTLILITLSIGYLLYIAKLLFWPPAKVYFSSESEERIRQIKDELHMFIAKTVKISEDFYNITRRTENAKRLLENL